eukprot:CAMPEP_0172481366 /NCGR_PEP_ID=MMETSP1066-20121228/7128_1 /TAXON_ID=671091 /ORGANISM="Coscinodiscus wailesii, Strain CCMP2513" /LENGTH=226 /DNA_ID=CAMNT_0013243551 /DNA_START=124 /DNA_END=804 /DNA_ORIENTATION=+
MRFSQLITLLAVGSAAAFTVPSPMQNRAFVSRPLAMAEEGGSEGGKLVPIKEETVEFTAGIVGGVLGFAVGGPVLGAIGAALANYASKTDQEVGDIVSAVSKSSIEIYNYCAKLDTKYEILNKAQNSLQSALDKLKAESGDNKEQIAKVEKALASTKDKIAEINDEYDLVGTATTALGVVGDLVEKAVKKAGELNDEYKLSEKAMSSVSKAVDTAKEASKEVQAKA